MSAVASQGIAHAVSSQRSGFAVRRVLLACGVVAFLLYVSMDGLAASLYDGYSYRDQTISELSAIGAPPRSWWVPLGAVYGVLMLAYAYGLWITSGRSRALRVIAVSVLLMAIMDLGAWPFAPMHQREVLAAGGGTFSDTLHLILAGANTVLFFLVMAVGSTILGSRFRAYSFVTIAVVFAFGTAMGIVSPGVQDNGATPWLGIYERVAVFGPMLWLAALGIALLRVPDAGAGDTTIRREGQR